MIQEEPAFHKSHLLLVQANQGQLRFTPIVGKLLTTPHMHFEANRANGKTIPNEPAMTDNRKRRSDNAESEIRDSHYVNTPPTVF